VELDQIWNATKQIKKNILRIHLEDNNVNSEKMWRFHRVYQSDSLSKLPTKTTVHLICSKCCYCCTTQAVSKVNIC